MSSPCSHCKDFMHNWCECPHLFQQAYVQHDRLIKASFDPHRKLAGISSLIQTFSKPLLKRLSMMFGPKDQIHSYYAGGYERDYVQFDHLKTKRDFQKYLLRKMMKIHQKSISRPVIRLVPNLSVDSAVDSAVDPANDEEECPICFTRTADVSTQCHHRFCGECTVTHLQKNVGQDRSCPLCRQNIQTLLYDNQKTFPKATCRKINRDHRGVHLRFQQDSYTTDWARMYTTCPEEPHEPQDSVEEEEEEEPILVTYSRIFGIYYRGSFDGFKKLIEKSEPEKSLHQQYYELRQQGVYVRRNGFRFRRGDFVL